MSVASVASISPISQFPPSASRQLTSLPVPIVHSPTPAVYATPIYKFDSQADIPVEFIRDPSTGTVLNQFPSAQVVEKYRRHELPQAANTEGTQSSAPTSENATPTGTSRAAPAIGSVSPSGMVDSVGGSIGFGAGASASASTFGVSITV